VCIDCGKCKRAIHRNFDRFRWIAILSVYKSSAAALYLQPFILLTFSQVLGELATYGDTTSFTARGSVDALKEKISASAPRRSLPTLGGLELFERQRNYFQCVRDKKMTRGCSCRILMRERRCRIWIKACATIAFDVFYGILIT
jgi:hypothetical protein